MSTPEDTSPSKPEDILQDAPVVRTTDRATGATFTITHVETPPEGVDVKNCPYGHMDVAVSFPSGYDRDKAFGMMGELAKALKENDFPVLNAASAMSHIPKRPRVGELRPPRIGGFTRGHDRAYAVQDGDVRHLYIAMPHKNIPEATGRDIEELIKTFVAGRNHFTDESTSIVPVDGTPAHETPFVGTLGGKKRPGGASRE